MRYLFLLVCFSISLLAVTAQEAMQKAQEFEKEGNVKEAMLWYKKAATLAMQKEDTGTKELPLYAKERVKTYEQRQEVFDKYIDKYDSKETDETVSQMVTGLFGIEPYKMNYLLPVTYDTNKHSDRKKFETKFQISLKKDISHDFLGFDETLSFGYTQKSWWQTAQNSAPFRETNYLPEVFVLAPWKDENSALKALQFGLLHESNGRDGLNSRSWNRLYMTSYFQLGGLFIAPRVWYRLSESKKKNLNDPNGDDNPDIYKYLGYGDLSLLYPWKKHVFSATLRNNLRDDNNRGALELGWTFPIWNSGVFGYIQYFTGYGESLIDYDKHSDKIGIGFSFTR